MNEELVRLMRGVKKKNEADFEHLYFLTKNRVRFFLLSKGLRGEELEELMTDCYFVVYRQAARFRGDSKVMTWIFGIVNVKCREYFRRRRRKDSVLLESPDETDYAMNASLSLDLREALRVLDREEYTIFVYKLCFELTYEEMNRLLRIPIGTLKRNIAEIKEKLQTRLREA